MNKEQQELLDDAFKKYQSQTMFRTDDLVSLKELDGMDMSTGERKTVYRQYAPVEFINKCKTNPEFSETWGLKIEERELNDDELNIANLFKQTSTKLITITYNNKTIESYE